MRPSHSQERSNLDLVGHTTMDFHKLFNAQALERWDDSFKLSLHEHCIEPVLVADRFENIKLYQR